MLEELGADYIVINGSDEGRLIDTLRNKIKNFASSVSLAGGRKYVILDEADIVMLKLFSLLSETSWKNLVRTVVL